MSSCPLARQALLRAGVLAALAVATDAPAAATESSLTGTVRAGGVAALTAKVPPPAGCTAAVACAGTTAGVAAGGRTTWRRPAPASASAGPVRVLGRSGGPHSLRAAFRCTHHASALPTLRPGRLMAPAAAAAVGALPAHTRATEAVVEPEALARAEVIRTEVDARYRLLPGRRLTVAEATTTAVLDDLVLLSDPFEPPRVVSASNGIYFAICAVHARCPYPGRSASWPAAAMMPRRQALELALRTFLETPVSLIVVSLPTADPVWAIFERDDLLGTVDAPMVLAQLAPVRPRTDTSLRELVDRLTQPRLFRPIPTLPPSPTILAIALGGP